ncbi:MAG: hypothetical protein KC457_31155, partial [Myxococcales bacterium]|nr:hypothetical protein [Myxococcales bacterium]
MNKLALSPHTLKLVLPIIGAGLLVGCPEAPDDSPFASLGDNGDDIDTGDTLDTTTTVDDTTDTTTGSPDCGNGNV